MVKIGVLLATRGLVMRAMRESRPADASLVPTFAERAEAAVRAPAPRTLARGRREAVETGCARGLQHLCRGLAAPGRSLSWRGGRCSG